MRRMNYNMRKAINYAGLMAWQFIINESDAEVLRRKDQAYGDKKHGN